MSGSRRWESAGHLGSSLTNYSLQPFSAGPASQASRPDAGPGKEVIPGTCHGSAPVPVTEALARSERAAGRRTLPRPAARFHLQLRAEPGERWPPPGPPSRAGPGAAVEGTRPGPARLPGPSPQGRPRREPPPPTAAAPRQRPNQRPTRPGTPSPWPAPAPARPGHSAPPLMYQALVSTSLAAATAAPSARFPSARCPRNQFDVSHPRARTINTSTTNPISSTSACPPSPLTSPSTPPTTAPPSLRHRGLTRP